MGNKIQYFLICVIALLAISGCTPSNSIDNVEPFLKIGDKVPNISWTTVKGEKIDLKQFTGRWVLLCYWCSCPVHRNDILTIKSVYDALYDKNLDVIVINDTYAQIGLDEFGKQNNVPFYLVEDNQKSINTIKPESATVSRRPIYFLIDTNGNLNNIELGTFDGTFYDSANAPTRLPANDWEAIIIDNDQLSQTQLKMLGVLIFLYDAIAVKFDDIYITNVTANGATIKWKSDKAVPCWVYVHSPLGFCAGPTEQNTKHKWILQDIYPTNNCTFAITASGFDKNKLQLEILLYNSSPKYSFSTLAEDYDKEYSDAGTHVYKNDLNISNVKISNITDKSADLFWETDEIATSMATLSTYDKPPIIKIKEDTNFTKHHAVMVDKLEPQQLYHLHLESEDVQGRFDNYELGFVTQPSNYASGAKISNIYLYDITDRSAKLKWSTDRSVWSSACYQYDCSAGDINTEHSSTLSYHLEPDTEYWVQILAHGESVSDVFNFRTLKTTDKVDKK